MSTTLPTPEVVLPHRTPALLIGKFLHHERGRLVAEVMCSPGSRYFAGHFPGAPIVPGVLILEMVAQTAAALRRLEEPATGRQPLPGRLGSIERARFFHEVVPGATLEVEARVVQVLGGLGKFAGSVHDESGRLVASTTMVLSASGASSTFESE